MVQTHHKFILRLIMRARAYVLVPQQSGLVARYSIHLLIGVTVFKLVLAIFVSVCVLAMVEVVCGLKLLIGLCMKEDKEHRS